MKKTFAVTIPTLKTVIPDALKEECNFILGSQNVTQVWVNEEDANGNPLKDDIDLYDTGDLKDSMTSDLDGYQFGTDYAAYVQAKHPFAGLSERSQQEALPKLQALFDEAGSTLTEEE